MVMAHAAPPAGGSCLRTVQVRYTSAGQGSLIYKAFRSMRCSRSRLILHWRGLGKNSQPCAPCSAPDRDTTRWRSADVPPVGLLEAPGNEGIFPPRTLRRRYPALAFHRREDWAHPVG